MGEGKGSISFVQIQGHFISIVFMELEFIAAKMDSTRVFAWVGGVGGGFYFFFSNA